MDSHISYYSFLVVWPIYDGYSYGLTLSNPIFRPPAYSPGLISLGGKKVGGLLVIILQFQNT
jgi:hypothetical protein